MRLTDEQLLDYQSVYWVSPNYGEIANMAAELLDLRAKLATAQSLLREIRDNAYPGHKYAATINAELGED